jgi:two-component system, cell cycle sensor histidine kinase and response regulator CckA
VVGEATRVSRAYLFRVLTSDGGPTFYRNTHEWCAPGVPPEIQRLQRVEEALVPWWAARVSSGQSIVVEDVSGLPPEAEAERQLLSIQGIRAVLAMPLRTRRGAFLGFMGFDDTSGPRAWSDQDRQALEVIAHMVSRELERRDAEEVLRRSEERHRLATLATRDVVYDWDIPSGELVVSSAIRSVVGHALPEIPNRGWWDGRIHPEDRGRVVGERDRALAKAGSWEGEYRFLRGDGSHAHVLDRGYIVRDEEDRPVRMVGTVSDLSERMQMEERLRQSQKMEALGRLAGGVAHDFNNLLSVILGSAGLLLEDTPPSDPRHGELLELRAAARQGASLTGQLLAVSRTQVLEPRSLDLRQVVADMERLLARLLGPSIELEAARWKRPLPVLADRSRLEQVLLNLVINARDAMPRGGRLRIVTEEVEAGTPLDTVSGRLAPGRHASLRVEDSGEGVDPALLPRIFEPFFTTKGTGRGTGLGLATVYGIVQQSGGRVHVAATPGGGATFTVYLPLLAEGVEAGGSGPTDPGIQGTGRLASAPVPGNDVSRETVTPGAAPDVRTSRGGTPLTFLLVEDDSGVAGLIRRALERAGHRVLVTHHPTEAEELFRTGSASVDLLITDVLLPDLSGPELATRLRELDPGLRILFISGHPGSHAGEVEAVPGPGAFLWKPFSIEELQERIEELLSPVGERAGEGSGPTL